MIDLNAKYFCARTIENKMTLAETLDKIRSLYKSISFESKIVRDGYDGLFDQKTRETGTIFFNTNLLIYIIIKHVLNTAITRK